MRYYELLTELRVIGDSIEDVEGKDFILTDEGYLFVYEDFDTIRTRLEEVLGIEEIPYIGSIDTSDIFPRWFIAGHIQDNKAYLDSHDITEENPSSVLNKELKKLVKDLKLDGLVTLDHMDGDEEEFSRKDIVDANIGDAIFYHGTSSSNLKSLLRKGIYSAGEYTNFKNIQHEAGTVFLTTKYEKAYFHAVTAANNTDSVPVVVKTKVPEPYRLILDYDVAVSIYGVNHPLVQELGYSDIYWSSASKFSPDRERELKYEEEWKNLIDKSSLNTRIGIFGYKGRIPSSNFVEIITDTAAIAELEVYGEIFDSEREPDMNVYRNPKRMLEEIEEYRLEIENDMDDDDYEE